MLWDNLVINTPAWLNETTPTFFWLNSVHLCLFFDIIIVSGIVIPSLDVCLSCNTFLLNGQGEKRGCPKKDLIDLMLFPCRLRSFFIYGGRGFSGIGLACDDFGVGFPLGVWFLNDWHGMVWVIGYL